VHCSSGACIFASNEVYETGGHNQFSRAPNNSSWDLLARGCDMTTVAYS
jgi:hypothetical protein